MTLELTYRFALALRTMVHYMPTSADVVMLLRVLVTAEPLLISEVWRRVILIAFQCVVWCRGIEC